MIKDIDSPIAKGVPLMVITCLHSNNGTIDLDKR